MKEAEIIKTFSENVSAAYPRIKTYPLCVVTDSGVFSEDTKPNSSEFIDANFDDRTPFALYVRRDGEVQIQGEANKAQQFTAPLSLVMTAARSRKSVSERVSDAIALLKLMPTKNGNFGSVKVAIKSYTADLSEIITSENQTDKYNRNNDFRAVKIDFEISFLFYIKSCNLITLC